MHRASHDMFYFFSYIFSGFFFQKKIISGILKMAKSEFFLHFTLIHLLNLLFYFFFALVFDLFLYSILLYTSFRFKLF
ncbi:hypothetical protein C1645_787335 [Glomus cerebriforme]|uniref:Uncharacterized protein n=1 Tax=Glomus cerebriforme TaxID=658196 RepID=A0A397SJJ0_9GLOM|nr:hypothetical protein C1645_787335 [Glomus cerebriforme]